MDFDLTLACGLFALTALVGGTLFWLARTQVERITVTGFLAGLLLYSGIGAANPDVPITYAYYYVTFVIVFGASYPLCARVLRPLGRSVGTTLPPVLENIDREHRWSIVILLYLSLALAPLLYPNLRISELLSPPLPDLTASFERRQEEQAALLRLIKYAQLLLTPFFYIALYKYRNHLPVFASALVFTQYVNYVVDSYISRGEITVTFGILFIALWISRPRRRAILVALSIAGVALLLPLAQAYVSIRLGAPPDATAIGEAADNLLLGETSFPAVSGVRIIESSERANLVSYVKWIVTLPIPKVLIGELDVPRINYDISEIVLRISRTSDAFFVVLPGLVAESIYVFGDHLFWIHACFIAFAVAFLVRITERVPQLLFFTSYIAMLITFTLNRGGIGATLPILVNGFLLFYAFLLVVVFRPRPDSRGMGISRAS